MNMAICFLVKQEANWLRNLFKSNMFALKILKSFPPGSRAGAPVIAHSEVYISANNIRSKGLNQV